MEGKMRKLEMFVTLLCTGLVFATNESWAWDENVTHRDLSELAAKNSSLGPQDYLKTIGFSKGLNEIIAGKEVFRWVGDGSRLEDKSDPLFPLPGTTTRGVNHYHNPLKPWNQAGLDDWVAVLHYTGESSLYWAQDWENQLRYLEGDWSWQTVRNYYYLALRATTDSERQEKFAKTFRGLGHQMHLIQDASQPDHARNNAHPFDIKGWKRWVGIERWAMKNPTIINGLAAKPDFPQVSFSVPDPYRAQQLAPITQLIDTTQYYTGRTPSASLAQGLSEYTNANFFSDDTIFAAEWYSPGDRHYFPYPKKSSTDLDDYFFCNKLPETVSGEDHIPDTAFWIKKNADGEQVDHFLKPTYLSSDISSFLGDGVLYRRTFYRDEECHKDYVKYLIPRAVGYSAALLNYFFRGNLRVVAAPIFLQGKLAYMKLKIKNMTLGEAMGKGNLVLTYRYTPSGGSANGSQDIFGQAKGLDGSAVVSSVPLGEGDTMEADFWIDPGISKEDCDSIKFMLAFRGTLGNEEGAVIGKSFIMGDVVFDEEWNNGPDGNNPWGHTEINLDNFNPPNNGVSTNQVENGYLIKDNIRYQGYSSGRFNESIVCDICGEGQFANISPIRITPNTYLMYKIDEMSITPAEDPARPQYLLLSFTDRLALEMASQVEQMEYWNEVTAYYPFPLGGIVVYNIYDLFKDAGITIPEPFYLRMIAFKQLLYPLQGPSTEEHHQRMKVDFIRIVEGKEQ
jgi:hypothetical protein